MNRAEVTDINFVTPDNPQVRANRTFMSLAPFAGAIVILGYVAIQHLNLINDINILESDINYQNHIATPASDTLTQYRESSLELTELQESFDQYQAALPNLIDWPSVIAHISSKLPGVNTLTPQVTLTSLELTSNSGATPMDYGAYAPNREVIAQANLTGSAVDKNAVADAIIEFELDPDLLYKFPGTSINNDQYDFRITIGMLGPVQEPTTDERDAERAER